MNSMSGLTMKATSGDFTDPLMYLSDVTKHMYLAKQTGPDILFAVSYLATRSKEANAEERIWITSSTAFVSWEFV